MKPVFIGLNDIANVPMTLKLALGKNGLKCDYYKWSNDEENTFGYKHDKVFFLFHNPPPFRIFGKNPFWAVNKLLSLFYLLYSVTKYRYFIFISPKTFFLNNRDLGLLKFFKKKIIILFTGCVERDVNFKEADDDYLCKRCKDLNLQKWCFCGDVNKKRALVRRLESYSDMIIGQDDITSYVEDKSKLIWLYLITEYPKKKANLAEKYSQKEIRIMHLPSNPLVKQSHIIIPVLKKFENLKGVRIILRDDVWSRERVEEELYKAHIVVNALGAGYNTLPIEAMSNGCTVFNGHPEWFRRNVPEAPIISVTAANLEDTLRYYINNRQELRDIAEKSVIYYEKYHSPESAGKYYKAKLKQL